MLGSLMKIEYASLIADPQSLRERLCEQEPSISPTIVQEIIDQIISFKGNSLVLLIGRPKEDK